METLKLPKLQITKKQRIRKRSRKYYYMYNVSCVLDSDTHKEGGVLIVDVRISNSHIFYV